MFIAKILINHSYIKRKLHFLPLPPTPNPSPSIVTNLRCIFSVFYTYKICVYLDFFYLDGRYIYFTVLWKFCFPLRLPLISVLLYLPSILCVGREALDIN